jgi:hypothetical protein
MSMNAVSEAVRFRRSIHTFLLIIAFQAAWFAITDTPQ